MKMPWQQLCRRNHRRREQRTQKEALQADCHRTHVKLWHQPKQQLHAHCNRQVNRNRELFAHPRRHEAQHDPPDRDPEPEARRDQTGAEGRAVADVDHEGDDPAAEGHFDADVDQQEAGAQPGDARGGRAKDGFLQTVARIF